MRTCHLFTLQDETAWHTIVPINTHVFGSATYARILERHFGYAARLFVVEHKDSSIAYPFFVRSLENLPFILRDQTPYSDVFSPDYTGPFLRGQSSPPLVKHFYEAWSGWCQQEHIVAEFAHLHPWDCLCECLEPASMHFNREIVYVDLTWSADRLWNDSFNYTCRKNIRRAQREGVRVATARSKSDIEAFYEIYIQTMNRNQASDRYYFSLDYFLDFFHLMSQNARFVLAFHGDHVVAGTLYLYDNDNIYSYLGGADHEFQRVRPTNAIVFETIEWGQSMGKKRLILGAGYRPEDGIFRFKASFSSLRKKFYIYKRVHLNEAYSSFCDQWTTFYGQNMKAGGFFPAYREVPAE